MYYLKFKTLAAFGESRWERIEVGQDPTYASELFDLYSQIYVNVQLLKDETITNTEVIREQ